MDAANYINTLDRLVLAESPPAAPQFAIIDLAVDGSFLNWLYGSMKQTTIEWFSLFSGSSWQSDWAQGPILVNLTASPAFARELTTRMEAKPLGVLIQSGAFNASLLQRCQHWLLSSTEASLLRFYEPRMLTPLMAALSDEQRRHLVAPSEHWAWHNGYGWQQYVSTTHEPPYEGPPPRISREQLNAVPSYRLALYSKHYAAHYRDHLTDYPEPKIWTMNCLLQARKAGFKTAAQQERWLRLAIENGAAFHKQDAFKSIIAQQALTHTEQLTAMESTSESLNASV